MWWMWPGSLVGSFVALGLWSAVFVGAGCLVLVVLCRSLPLLCVVVIVVRWCCHHLLGSGSRLLGGCRHLAAGVVCSGEGCVTWHGDGVLRWWWLGVEE